MPMLNVFNNNAFSTVSLTESINKLPHVPSRIGSMNLFRRRGVTTTKIFIEEKHGKLSLLRTAPRGSQGSTTRQRPKRKGRLFQIPHIPHDTEILADDVMDVRAFGSESDLEAVASVVNQELADMKQDHEVTWEYHRIGAIKGEILDADGSTLYNLFDEFGLTQQTVSFDFAIVTPGYLKGKCVAIERLMQSALGATGWSGIHAFCGDQFFDNFVSHPQVAESYLRSQDNRFNRELQTGPTGFEWGGITWENYRGGVGETQFVDTDKAHFFVEGSPGLFAEYNAPADFMEAVGTVGKPYYAKQEKMKFDKGIELHTQSNPLFINQRPMSSVEGTDDT